MTMTAPPTVFDRLRDLPAETVATVTGAFGRMPSGDDSPEDLERLGLIIDAVVAGQTAAQAASDRAGMEVAPMTAEEAATPELPEIVAPTTATLRARIGAMDAAARQVFLGRWAASGLPQVLKDGDGGDIILDAAAHVALERLIAEHEKPADGILYERLVGLVKEAPPGVRYTVEGRMAGHGLPNITLSTATTEGRRWLLGHVLEQATAEHADTVADAIGPVTDGRIVTEPVADAAELAEAPPSKGTIDDLVEWVKAGDDPADRARLLTYFEQAKDKPRNGLLKKLAAMIPGGAVPLPSVATGVHAAPSGPAPAPVGVPDAVAPPPGDAVSPSPPTGAAPSLESTLFRSTPVEEWGPLTRAAYFGRLGYELEVAARIAGELAAQANAEANR